MHPTKDSLDADATIRPAAFEAEASAFLAAHPETRAVEL